MAVQEKNKLSLIILLLIIAGLIFFNWLYFPGNILSWDVFGYYMYLPMIFIYNNWGLHDVNILHSILDHYHNSSTLYQAYQTGTGFWVMRYPMGMAILYSPFFFIAHMVAGFTHYAKDGFSLPYQVAILSAGIFYSILGFYILRKILLRYFTDGATALTLFIIYFGTNYFMHSSFNGSNAMSHNYLFTVYALIVWLTIKWHESFKTSYLVLLGFTCGINMIARPSEIVCLLLPALWEVGSKYSLNEKLKLFLKMKWQVIAFLGILIIIAVPQLIYWKIITGKFLFNSYGNNAGEGFEFLHPYISQVLFSFRKGWLIYTPVMLFAVAGIFLLFKKHKEFSVPVLVYFFINLFIVSSWSCWWYAESFGQRSLIQSYAVMALPLAFSLSALNNLKPALKKLFFAIISFFVLLNLFQTWQFLHGIIHESRMTKAAYFAGFAKTKIPGGMEDMLLIDRSGKEPVSINEKKYVKTKEWVESFENNYQLNNEVPLSGKRSFKLDSLTTYSPSIEKPYEEITSGDHVMLKISMQIFCKSDIKDTPGSLVACFEHNGYSYGYVAKDLQDFNINLNKWTEISFNYLTPVIRTNKDKLKVYYWNRGKMPVYIDDLKVEVWEAKN